MTVLARLAGRSVKAGVPSISSDGTFITVPWFQQLLGWLPTRAGVHVDEDTALALPIVYACVRVIAESIASLPLITYRRTADGGKERALDSPWYPIFHDSPNPEMTSFGFRETLMTHLTTWGNGFNEIREDNTGRTQIWPLPPNRVEVGWESGHKVFDYYTDGGEKKRLDASRIWHIPGLSTNGLVGLSPIQAHRESLGEMAATRNFGANFYRNNARPGGIMEHPANLSAGAIERLATQMDQLRGTGNAGKTMVLEEGMKFHEVGVPPEDAQYIETRRLQREDVCSIFRMPPHMVGVLDHATFSNIEHQSIDFVVHTLRPWLVRLEQSIKAFFLAQEPDIFVEFLVDGLLRGDAKGRAEALAVELEHGAITYNEWRGIENRNPYPVDVRWAPAANYTAQEIDKDGNLIAPEVPDVVPPAVQSPPQLTVVKSAVVHCPSCGKRVAELATPPYRLMCRGCKTVITADAEVKSEPEIERSLLTEELSAVLTDLAEGMRSLTTRPQMPVELVALTEAMRQQGDAITRLAERDPTVVVEQQPRTLRIVRTDDGAMITESA